MIIYRLLVILSFLFVFSLSLPSAHAQTDFTLCPDDFGSPVDGLECTGGGGPEYRTYRNSNSTSWSVRRTVGEYSCTGDRAYCASGSNNCIRCLHRPAPAGNSGQNTTACVDYRVNGEVMLDYECFDGNSCPSNWTQSTQRNCVLQSNGGLTPKTCCHYNPPSSGSETDDPFENPQPDTRPLCPITGDNPDYYCSSSREISSDIESVSHRCSDGSKCFKENPTRGGSSTTTQTTGYTCEDPSTANGRIWDCRTSCSPGVVGGTGALYLCPNAGEFCCDMGPSSSGGSTSTGGGTGTGTGGSTPATPSETCVYYGVSCKNTTDANEIVKQGSSETAPYKSGNQCGGNYHDVYECTNNTTGAKRLDPRPISASNGVCAPGGSWCAVSTNPCQTRGGLMGGVAPVPKCGNVAYDSAQASKTQAQGNPYCSKAYSVDYQCSDGSWESRTTGYAPGICDALPWCTTASTPTTGTGEACAGAPSAVGGNCPSTKPICNRSSTQGDCVAQASVANGGFCAKASACQSGTCTSQTCQSPAAPTPPPLSLDVYCPVIDSDGKPNTCYYSSSCPSGYTLKSNNLSHQACDQHTSGTNPYCCHKDTASGSTGGALSPACPNVDTDGKPNSCADKGPSGNPGANCPAGYSYKNAPQGDSDCTSHRSVPSVCCHQGSGT